MDDNISPRQKIVYECMKEIFSNKEKYSCTPSVVNSLRMYILVLKRIKSETSVGNFNSKSEDVEMSELFISIKSHDKSTNYMKLLFVAVIMKNYELIKHLLKLIEPSKFFSMIYSDCGRYGSRQLFDECSKYMDLEFNVLPVEKDPSYTSINSLSYGIIEFAAIVGCFGFFHIIKNFLPVERSDVSIYEPLEIYKSVISTTDSCSSVQLLISFDIGTDSPSSIYKIIQILIQKNVHNYRNEIYKLCLSHNYLVRDENIKKKFHDDVVEKIINSPDGISCLVLLLRNEPKQKIQAYMHRKNSNGDFLAAVLIRQTQNCHDDLYEFLMSNQDSIPDVMIIESQHASLYLIKKKQTQIIKAISKLKHQTRYLEHLHETLVKAAENEMFELCEWFIENCPTLRIFFSNYNNKQYFHSFCLPCIDKRFDLIIKIFEKIEQKNVFIEYVKETLLPLVRIRTNNKLLNLSCLESIVR